MALRDVVTKVADLLSSLDEWYIALIHRFALLAHVCPSSCSPYLVMFVSFVTVVRFT
jgi:hypothetical protein